MQWLVPAAAIAYASSANERQRKQAISTVETLRGRDREAAALTDEPGVDHLGRRPDDPPNLAGERRSITGQHRKARLDLQRCGA